MKQKLIEIIEKAGDEAIAKHIPLTSTYLASRLIAEGVVVPVRCYNCESYSRNGYRCCGQEIEAEEGYDCYKSPDDFCSCGRDRK